MTQKVDQYPMYPVLDTHSQFRLSEISKMKSKLQDEISERTITCKKYKRAENILDDIDIGANSVALTLSVTSGIMASTLVLLPLALPMAVTAGSLACVGIVCKSVNRKLHAKSKKHASIVQIAESKLNSIIDIINKAINDDNITDSEFRLVVNEMEKYFQLKKAIQTKRVKNNTSISEDEKKKIIEEAKKDFLNQLK